MVDAMGDCLDDVAPGVQNAESGFKSEMSEALQDAADIDSNTRDELLSDVETAAERDFHGWLTRRQRNLKNRGFDLQMEILNVEDDALSRGASKGRPRVDRTDSVEIAESPTTTQPAAVKPKDKNEFTIVDANRTSGATRDGVATGDDAASTVAALHEEASHWLAAHKQELLFDKLSQMPPDKLLQSDLLKRLTQSQDGPLTAWLADFRQQLESLSTSDLSVMLQATPEEACGDIGASARNAFVLCSIKNELNVRNPRYVGEIVKATECLKQLKRNSSVETLHAAAQTVQKAMRNVRDCEVAQIADKKLSILAQSFHEQLTNTDPKLLFSMFANPDCKWSAEYVLEHMKSPEAFQQFANGCMEQAASTFKDNCNRFNPPTVAKAFDIVKSLASAMDAAKTAALAAVKALFLGQCPEGRVNAAAEEFVGKTAAQHFSGATKKAGNVGACLSALKKSVEAMKSQTTAPDVAAAMDSDLGAIAAAEKLAPSMFTASSPVSGAFNGGLLQSSLCQRYGVKLASDGSVIKDTAGGGNQANFRSAAGKVLHNPTVAAKRKAVSHKAASGRRAEGSAQAGQAENTARADQERGDVRDLPLRDAVRNDRVQPDIQTEQPATAAGAIAPEGKGQALHGFNKVGEAETPRQLPETTVPPVGHPTSHPVVQPDGQTIQPSSQGVGFSDQRANVGATGTTGAAGATSAVQGSGAASTDVATQVSEAFVQRFDGKAEYRIDGRLVEHRGDVAAVAQAISNFAENDLQAFMITAFANPEAVGPLMSTVAFRDQDGNVLADLPNATTSYNVSRGLNHDVKIRYTLAMEPPRAQMPVTVALKGNDMPVFVSPDSTAAASIEITVSKSGYKVSQPQVDCSILTSPQMPAYEEEAVAAANSTDAAS
jgi:hypothetical protein